MMQAHNIALMCGLASTILGASLFYLLKPISRKDKKGLPFPRPRMEAMLTHIKKNFTNVKSVKRSLICTNLKTTGPCPGLLNLGRTCFLNSILQALSSCKSFVNWLEFILDHTYPSKNSLVFDVYTIMKILNNESIEHTDDYNPKCVLDNLYTKGWVISNGEHDACELFHVLMESLNEEQIDNPSIIPLFDLSTLQNFKNLSTKEAVNKINTDLPKLNSTSAPSSSSTSLSSSTSSTSSSSSPSSPSFSGRLASQLICRMCGFKTPTNYQSFCSLSLPLPNNQYGSMSLESLLTDYLKSECIDMTCDRCKVRRPFLKKNFIGKLPPSLCIHIQRTTWSSSLGPIKRTDPLVFPDHIDMSPYLWPGSCGGICGGGGGGGFRLGGGFGGLALSGVMRGDDVHKMGLLGGKVKVSGGENNGDGRDGGGRVGGDGGGGCKGRSDDIELAGNSLSEEWVEKLRSPPRSIKKRIRLKNPYSISVNLLKALNYHSHLSHLGLQNAIDHATPSSPSSSSSSSAASSSLSSSAESSSSTFTSPSLDLVERKTMISPNKTMSEYPRAVTTLANAYQNDSYCCKKSANQSGGLSAVYRLSSVIVHYGGATSGHFVTYKRVPTRYGVRFPNRWIHASDTCVRECSPLEVFTSAAYMLMYERL